MKYYGVEISEEKIRWLYWYVRIATEYMVAERRMSERITANKQKK